MKTDNKQFYVEHPMRPFTDALESDVFVAVRNFERDTAYRVQRIVMDRLPSGWPVGVIAHVRPK